MFALNAGPSMGRAYRSSFHSAVKPLGEAATSAGIALTLAGILGGCVCHHLPDA